MKGQLHKNPDFDDAFIVQLHKEVPTKQDSFKKLFGRIYLRKRENRHRIFEAMIKEVLAKEKKIDWPYKGRIEVVVGITGKASRLKGVDVDNLLKAVLDSLKGVVFEDDKQIQRALVSKDLLDADPPNSLGIGIRDLEKRSSMFEIKLLVRSTIPD
jgi:Holliday junction resolvase RusA-like endonuclease